MAQSLLEGKRSWTKWAAPRHGLTCEDWAGPWMTELKKCGLPRIDYLVWAPNATLDGWLKRPAQYQDFSRAYHLLHMVYGGESPQSVIE